MGDGGRQRQEEGVRPQIRGLIRRMKRGDTLIVTEVSRLSRTLTDLMAIMGKCLEKGINLYTTKEGYSFDNSINSKVLCFAFGLVAEIERNLISMRTKEASPSGKPRVSSLVGKRQLHENERADRKPKGHRWHVEAELYDCRYMQAFRHFAGYIHEIP